MRYVLIIAAVLLAIYIIKKAIPFVYKVKSRKEFAGGNYVLSKELYKKAMKLSGSDYSSKMEFAHMLLRTGDFDEAEALMNSLLSTNLDMQKRNRAILQRCMCYYKNNNLDEAYADAQELYDDGYKTMILYGLLGYFKILKAPLSDETLVFCLEAYDYASDDRDICDNLLICYYNRGDYEKAKEISDFVIDKNPKFVEAWYHAAQIDVAMGDYKSAMEKIEKTSGCNRSHMTTISVDEVEKLRNLIKEKI